MIFQQEKCIFSTCVLSSNVTRGSYLLDSKTQKKLKMKKRVTTFASDTPEASMVQIDKDVDALMHLKITVVELYKRLLSRLDQSLQIGNILQDWIDDML